MLWTRHCMVTYQCFKTCCIEVHAILSQPHLSHTLSQYGFSGANRWKPICSQYCKVDVEYFATLVVWYSSGLINLYLIQYYHAPCNFLELHLKPSIVEFTFSSFFFWKLSNSLLWEYQKHCKHNFPCWCWNWIAWLKKMIPLCCSLLWFKILMMQLRYIPCNTPVRTVLSFTYAHREIF